MSSRAFFGDIANRTPEEIAAKFSDLISEHKEDTDYLFDFLRKKLSEIIDKQNVYSMRAAEILLSLNQIVPKIKDGE